MQEALAIIQTKNGAALNQNGDNEKWLDSKYTYFEDSIPKIFLTELDAG